MNGDLALQKWAEVGTIFPDLLIFLQGQNDFLLKIKIHNLSPKLFSHEY